MKDFEKFLFPALFHKMASNSFTSAQENYLRLQAQEFLHYKKVKLKKEIRDRVDKRVKNLAAKELATLGVALNNDNTSHVCAPAHVPAAVVQTSSRSNTSSSRQKTSTSKKLPVDGITWEQLEALGLPGMSTNDWHINEHAAAVDPVLATPVQTNAHKTTATASVSRGNPIDLCNEMPTKHSLNPNRESPPPRKRHRACQTQPEAAPIPWAIPTATYTASTVVPKSIELLWKRVTAMDPMPNTPQCCATCPFTTGPPMLRRYNTMLAMMNLEDYLYFNGAMMSSFRNHDTDM